MGTVQDSVRIVDGRSFERTYPALKAGLRRFLFRRGSKRARNFRMTGAEYAELLDQVTDETLCVAWQRAGEYDPERGPLGWWIAMLGRKVLTTELRRWLREHQHRRDLEDPGRLPDPAVLPGFRTVEDRDRLGRALALIPKDQAEALALFYLYELSADEVGKVLDRGPEAVRSLLQRARANARKALEDLPVRRPGRPRKGGRA